MTESFLLVLCFSTLSFLSTWKGAKIVIHISKVRMFQRDHEGTLSIFLSMENIIDCTKVHCSSYRTILDPLEKEG
jgi:hypothetical protein